MRKVMINKRIARLMSFVIISLMLLATSTFSASAAQKSFVLDQERDIEISIVYEGSEPSVTVTGPNNRTYTSDAQFDKVERTTGITNLYIKGASSGRWNVQTSSNATITILSWNEPLTVSSFKVSAVQDDQITVTALVKHPERISYNWRIYAIPDFKTTGLMDEQQILLRDTFGSTNEESKTDVSIRDLPDGNWTIAMEAFYTYPDGIEVDGTAQISKPITVTGHVSAGADADFVTVTDLTDNVVTIDWSKVNEAGIYYDEMLVSVLGDQNEPVFYSTFEHGVHTAQVVDNGNASRELTIRLMPLNNGSFSVLYSRKISFAPSISLSIETAEATGGMMAKIAYNIGNGEKPLDVTINGNTTRYRIVGDSSISVSLESLVNNEIIARCYVTETDAYQVTKTITVLNDPPVLTLYGISDQMVTNQSVISISGTTDPGATLTLNGDPVDVGKDGSFTAKASLQLGDNSLVFCAKNAYGIQTVRTVSVNFTEGDIIDLQSTNRNKLGWFPIALGGSLALISAVTLMLIFSLSKKRNKKRSVITVRMIAAVLGLATLIFAVFATYSFYMRGVLYDAVTGDNLVNALKVEDYQGIADQLDQMDSWQSRAVIMTICSAISLMLMILLLILFAVISKKIKNRPTPPVQPPFTPYPPSSWGNPTPPAQ